MKKIIVFSISLFCVVIAFAQPARERAQDKVKAQRVAFITERLNLTSEEAQQFWPIYNEYTTKLQQIRTGAKLDKLSDDMTDADAEKLILAEIDKESRELDLRKEYFTKLKKAISPKKIAKLYKAERDFRGELVKQLQEMKQARKQLRDN
jgi:GTP1/Obg family GTP-binding protein